MSNNNIATYAMILDGGTESRLWPVSRELYPKQLVKLVGTDSLIQSTVKRLFSVIDSEKIRVVCGKELYFETKRHLETINMSVEGKILREPIGRNTAPAILLAALQILQTEEYAVKART